MNGSKKIEVEILLNEYAENKRLADSTYQGFSSVEILPITSVIVALIAAKDFPLLWIVIPFCMLYVFYSVLKRTILMFHLSAYTTFLEHRIETLMGEPLVLHSAAFKDENPHRGAWYIIGGYFQVPFMLFFFGFSLFMALLHRTEIENHIAFLNNPFELKSLFICWSIFLIITIMIIIFTGIYCGRCESTKYQKLCRKWGGELVLRTPKE